MNIGFKIRKLMKILIFNNLNENLTTNKKI